MIARYPADRLAIILLSNTAGANMGALETQIAKLLLNVEDKPIADMPIDEARLKQLVGTYDIEGLKVELTAEDGKLFATPNGQAKDRLRYQGDQTFVSSNDSDIRITFTPAEGEAQGFEADNDGHKLSGKRVK
jgi:hypothetical protein